MIQIEFLQSQCAGESNEPAKAIQIPIVSFCAVIVHTWTPHPLQAALDDWMMASSSAALVHWPSPARQTAQTGFCGRKHSCKQVWQNLLTVGGKKDTVISEEKNWLFEYFKGYFTQHCICTNLLLTPCWQWLWWLFLSFTETTKFYKESNVKQNNILNSPASLLGTRCLHGIDSIRCWKHSSEI